MCFGNTNEQYVCNQSWSAGGTTSNNIVGTLPDSIGSFSELTTLSFNRNTISGVIPTTIGNLKKLVSLFLSEGTQLTGSLPTQLGQITTLQRLQIDGNNLSGPIPVELNNTSLNYLWANNNKFTSLPDLSARAWSQLQVGNNLLS